MNQTDRKNKAAQYVFGAALLIVPALLLWIYYGPKPGGEESTETFETIERTAPEMTPLEQMEEMWRTAPGHGPVALELGNLYLEAGRFDKALEFYREFQKTDTTAEGWLVVLDISRALVALGRPEEAISELNAALDKHPGHAGTLYNLGAIEANRGQHDLARKHWQQLIDLHPADTLAIFARASLPKLK